jgi:hypothetical protein
VQRFRDIFISSLENERLSESLADCSFISSTHICKLSRYTKISSHCVTLAVLTMAPNRSGCGRRIIRIWEVCLPDAEVSSKLAGWLKIASFDSESHKFKISLKIEIFFKWFMLLYLGLDNQLIKAAIQFHQTIDVTLI